MDARDDSVQCVEDAATSMRNLKKNDDAQWVNGLGPHDDGYEAFLLAQQKARLENEAFYRQHGGGGAFQRSVPSHGADRIWLRTPFILTSMFLVAFVIKAFGFSSDMTSKLEYAARETDTWPIIRAHSFLALYLPIVVVTLLAIASSISLCVQVGVASDRFFPFLGIGISFLALLGVIGDGLLLFGACKEGSTYCDLPFIMHWFCGVFRNTMPQLALWTCGFVLDEVRPSPTLRHVWSVLLALPVVCHGAFVFNAWKTEAPSEHELQIANGVQVCVTLLLLWKIYNQRQFGVVVPKVHKE